jgi:hypothetical protein
MVLRLLAAGKFDQRIATTWWRSNGQKARDPRHGKLGAADRTEPTQPGLLGPGPLTPHPSRPGNTFG